MKLVAKAFVTLAKQRVRQERITNAVHRLEPNVVLGERDGYDAIILDGRPLGSIFVSPLVFVPGRRQIYLE